MSRGPAVVVTLLGLLAAAAIIATALEFWPKSTSTDHARTACRAKNAAPAYTDHEHYRCVDEDGRVVP